MKTLPMSYKNSRIKALKEIHGLDAYKTARAAEEAKKASKTFVKDKKKLLKKSQTQLDYQFKNHLKAREQLRKRNLSRK